MASKIYLVRHAESEHNVSKDFSQLDPALTPLGLQQAAELGEIFPYSSQVATILTSPLRRAIQTTLSAFPHILDRQYFEPGSKKGVENGAKLVVDADLQERSALPCDTGSDRAVLEESFPGLNFQRLKQNWHVKEGIYSETDEAVKERAKRVRGRLADLSSQQEGERKDILVVTHGTFMKFLTEDWQIDLPKAGWKEFAVDNNGERGFIHASRYIS
jgi:broad specificity phosphatase PhoE